MKNYILKNGHNEYLIFNCDTKTKSLLHITERAAEKIRYLFGLEPISPVQYVEMGLCDFRSIWIN